jgi:hypothetical protein
MKPLANDVQSAVIPEAALDRIDINTLGGADSVISAGLAAGAIQFFVDGALVR